MSATSAPRKNAILTFHAGFANKPATGRARSLGTRSGGLAFRSRHRHPVLARLREQSRMGSAQGDQDVRRPAALRRVPGRVAARWLGPALDPERTRRPADLRLRDRRHDRDSEDPRRVRGFPDRLRTVQRHPAGRVFSARLELADARAVRPAAAAALGGAPRAVSRRHLLLRRSRSAGSSRSSRRAGWSTSAPTRTTSSTRR